MLARLGVATIVGIVGVFLLLDAATFALRPVDFEGHRAGGCYVLVDDLVDAKEPTEWARPAELALSSLFVLVALFLGGRALWSGFARRPRSG